MTYWETLNSIVKGVEFVVAGGVCGLAGYFTLLEGLQFIDAISPFNKKVKSQAQLEKVVRERAQKLGLNPNNIDVKYSWIGETYADKRGERDILSLGNGLGCKINSVDHELCHIKNRDCDREESKDWYYYFVAEPRAVLYEVFGLKVGWKKK
jgi:hypothetical protein